MTFLDLLGRRDETPDPWDVMTPISRRMGFGLTKHDADFSFLEAVTMGEFILAHCMKTKYPWYHNMDEFIEVAKECYLRHLGTEWAGDGSPWADPSVVEKYMSEVVDVCKRRHIWYHPGWLKCLTSVRARLRGQNLHKLFRASET